MGLGQTALDEDLVDEIVSYYSRGNWEPTSIALILDIPPRTLLNWLAVGKRALETSAQRGRMTKHRKRCRRLYRETEKAKLALVDSLKVTRLNLARGVPAKDDRGRPIAGEYKVMPKEHSLDVAQANYDDGFRMPGKDLTVSAGEGWLEMREALAHANAVVDAWDEDAEGDG